MEPTLDEMAKACKALGNPVRLKILYLLAQQDEYYCGDLVSLVGMAQSTVSHHLKILKDSGWVETEERGTFVCYRVRREKMEQLSNFLLTF